MSRVVAACLVIAVVAAACSAGAGTPSPSASRHAASPSAPSPGSPAASPPLASPSVSAAPSTSGSASPSQAPARPDAWAAIDAGAGPAAREDHTWTVGNDGDAWLFGGRDGATVFDDLWRYDLARDTWKRLAPSGPAPDGRFGHTSSWIDGIGLVIWSGQVGSTFFNDLWAFDPAAAAWRELPAGGPVPAARYGSCAAVDPDGRLWISHGFTQDAGRFADTWVHDFATSRWTNVTRPGQLPVARCLHDCLWTPDGRFLLYAGQTTGIPAIGDLWTRPADGDWMAAPDAEPAARQLYAITTRGDDAWVFGGGAEDRSKLGDLWTLDLASLAWRQITLDGPAPSARSAATLITDAATDRLLLFGGLTGTGASEETWALELGG